MNYAALMPYIMPILEHSLKYDYLMILSSSFPLEETSTVKCKETKGKFLYINGNYYIKKTRKQIMVPNLPRATSCREAFLIIYGEREKVRRFTWNISQTCSCINHLAQQGKKLISLSKHVNPMTDTKMGIENANFTRNTLGSRYKPNAITIIKLNSKHKIKNKN